MSTPIQKYRFIPERIGRRDDIKPFTVVIENPDETDADRLAEGLHAHVKQFLLSNDYGVSVDLRRERFSIEGGRFGKGRIEIVKEKVDV